MGAPAEPARAGRVVALSGCTSRARDEPHGIGVYGSGMQRARTDDSRATGSEAERLWRQRYSRPEVVNRALESAPSGREWTVLHAFVAWREQRLDDALELAGVVGGDSASDHLWRARALGIQAAVYGEIGLLGEALAFRRAEEVQSRLSGDIVQMLSCAHDFGPLYEYGDPEVAQRQYLSTVRDVDQHRGVPEEDRDTLLALRALAVVNLYTLARDRGLAVPAETPTLEQTRRSVLSAWPEMAGTLAAMMASEALDRGDVERAGLLARDMPDPAQMRDVVNSVFVTNVTARLLVAEGRAREAALLLENAADLLPPSLVPEALQALVEIYESVDDLPAALSTAKRLNRALRRVHDADTAATVRALEVAFRTDRAIDAASEARAEALTLRDQALRDPTTGVWNRRYLLAHGPEALRSGGGSLAVVDIDRFKMINDEHGHREGDRALREVAAALLAATRPDDIIARFGGDEFVVVRPRGHGQTLASDLGPLARLVPAGEKNRAGRARVTLSIGIADAQLDWTTTFDAADGAMYLAKRGGGGATVTHEG